MGFRGQGCAVPKQFAQRCRLPLQVSKLVQPLHDLEGFTEPTPSYQEISTIGNRIAHPCRSASWCSRCTTWRAWRRRTASRVLSSVTPAYWRPTQARIRPPTPDPTKTWQSECIGPDISQHVVSGNARLIATEKKPSPAVHTNAVTHMTSPDVSAAAGTVRGKCRPPDDVLGLINVYKPT